MAGWIMVGSFAALSGFVVFEWILVLTGHAK